nr:PmoA family protein [Streptomyces smaragdinus]
MTLTCRGRTVARYLTAPGLPRPYFHPVTTLAGVPVTEERPADHVHHLGAGIAVPDVDGHNFWGGRTYVRGRGPTELDNHGTQHHVGCTEHRPDGFTADLSWTADGHELLRERRTVRATGLDDTAWALDLTFALTNTTPAPLSFGSPQTNGRPGAAYGGFFWRAPKEPRPPHVFTPAADGEEAVHGSTAGWLALAGDGWTLVHAGGDDTTRRDPWFVRTADYPGTGSSLAFAGRVPLHPGETLRRRVVTVVADGTLDRNAAAVLATRAVGP